MYRRGFLDNRPATTRKTIDMMIDGKFHRLNQPSRPDRANFVIVCDYGDWSGFRTLAECEAQYQELIEAGRPNGFYWVEER